MFNLIIGMTSGVAHESRLFEGTEESVKVQFRNASGQPDVSRLMALPTLLMPEVQPGSDSSHDVARIGRVTAMQRAGRDYSFTFEQHPHIPPIPVSRIVELSDRLGVSTPFGWTRTYWAVKEGELFEIAHEAVGPPKFEPTAFKFPSHLGRDHDLVAVMMPFAGFDAVYEAIKGAAEDAGFRCLRADDIWESQHILDDILSLIWRAQVIVSDFTGRNANVFYETGIAHAIGRTVVPITQAMADVPFDLQAIRAQQYLNNGEGLADLRTSLAARLAVLG